MSEDKNLVEQRKQRLFADLLESTHITRRGALQAALAAGVAGPAALGFATADVRAQTPAAGPKGGDGTLIVTTGGDPLSFNPNFQVDDNAFVPTLNIYDTLVTLDSQYSVLPALATSWETSEDELSITFHLVEGATWHDGEPFSSADTKYTFEQIIANASASANSLVSAVTSVDAPDANTAVFNLKQPSASLISFIGWYGTVILPAHIYEGTDWSTNPANQSPIGTGPFKFVSYAPGSQIELEANLDYWGEGPYLDRIVMPITPDSNTATQALLNGETDLLVGGISFQQVPTLKETEGIRVDEVPIPSFYYLQFNVNREITGNPDVRTGLSQAINRQQICDLALGGFSSPATTYYPTSIEWAANTDPAAAVPAFDKAAAEATLDAAGYPLVDGKRFSVEFVHFTFGSDWDDTAAVIKQNLEDVGIETTITVLEIGAFGDAVLAGEFDINMLAGLWGPDPENLKIRVGTGGAVNSSGYSNPEVDQLLDEGSKVTDVEQRAPYYWQVQQILATDKPILPLADVVLFYPYADKVSGLPFVDGVGKTGINRFNLTRIAQ